MPQTIASLSTESLLNRIKAREARIGVIGLGYVGLPLSLLYTSQNFPVTGFDIDEKKVNDLQAGRSYIYTASLQKKFRMHD